MALTITAFGREHLDAVGRFSARTWSRPSSPEFLRWRYLEPPGQRGWVALRDGECVATLFALERRYRGPAGDRAYLETFDWFCRSDLRLSGLGVRLMQLAMRAELPLLAVGGTDDTRALLPRLRFAALGGARRFWRPCTPGALRDALASRYSLPRAVAGVISWGAARSWFRPRRAAAPAGGSVARMAPDARLSALYRGSSDAIWPLPEPAGLAWLLRAGGHWQLSGYEIAGEPRGWTLCRVSRTEGRSEAMLVDLHARDGDPSLYAWMIGEALASLAPHAPEVIWAQTTTPSIARALSRLRFVELGQVPVAFWSSAGALPEAPLMIQYNASDFPVRPYLEDAGG